jgi:hypothetical protein
VNAVLFSIGTSKGSSIITKTVWRADFYSVVPTELKFESCVQESGLSNSLLDQHMAW